MEIPQRHFSYSSLTHNFTKEIQPHVNLYKQPTYCTKSAGTFQDLMTSESLNSQFQSFIKNYENFKEEHIQLNFIHICNAFSILLESNIAFFFENVNMWKLEASNILFKFYFKGKIKEISINKEKGKEFNYFDLLYRAYLKFKKMIYCNHETIVEINDILHDISGLPILEFSLNNKIVLNKLNNYMRSLLDNQNSIIMLCGEDNLLETVQSCFQVISYFEKNEKSISKEYPLKEGENSNNLILTTDRKDNSELKEIRKLLLKLRKFNSKIILKTFFDYKYLLEDRNLDYQELKELYPTGMGNYTYISQPELSSIFTRLLIIEKVKREKQIGGKFIKCRRHDGITEYKSRWIYTFNVTNDNFEVIIGVHQNVPNSYSIITPYLYIGLVILRSNSPLLNFVDYLPLKECRQNFIKVILNKGSYVVVPITSGFYLDHPEERLIDIESVQLLEQIIDKKTKKINEDFTLTIKNIIDDIFEKFDINRKGFLNINELSLFMTYVYGDEVFQDLDYLKTNFNSIINDKGEINLKSFRNYFYLLLKSRKELEIYKIFKKFGYSNLINFDSRNFYMTFNSNTELDVKLSDGLNNRFNTKAYELYLRHVGTVMNIDENKYINLIYDQTRDSCNLILMLENKSDNDKTVTLEIESSVYISTNGYTYKNTLKAKENRYLFSMAIDKSKVQEITSENLMIKYHVICE